MTTRTDEAAAATLNEFSAPMWPAVLARHGSVFSTTLERDNLRSGKMRKFHPKGASSSAWLVRAELHVLLGAGDAIGRGSEPKLAPNATKTLYCNQMYWKSMVGRAIVTELTLRVKDSLLSVSESLKNMNTGKETADNRESTGEEAPARAAGYGRRANAWARRGSRRDGRRPRRSVISWTDLGSVLWRGRRALAAGVTPVFSVPGTTRVGRAGARPGRAARPPCRPPVSPPGAPST